MADREPERHKADRLAALLEQDPNDEVALFALGKTLLKLKDYDGAIRALERCVGVKPDYSAAYQALAVALFKAGGVERSVETGRKGIEVSSAKGDLMVTNQLRHFLDRIGT